MIHPSLEDSKFWDILECLMKMEGKQEIQFLVDQLQVDKAMLEKGISFLEEMNVVFQRVTVEGKEYIESPKIKPKIKFEFELVDWLKFQAHFPLLHGFQEQPFHQKVAANLAKIEDQYKRFDLFRAVKVIGSWGEKISEKIIPSKLLNDLLNDVNAEKDMNLEAIKDVLKTCVEDKSCVSLRMEDHSNSIKVYPHRLVHIEGELSLVAEEMVDKSLIYLPLDKMMDVKDLKEQMEAPLHSSIEIDDFLSSIRAISGTEVRLVLKILNPEQVQELTPLYHFLRKPYVISNPKGDLIWAASVEESEDIYEWISNLETKIEILDPTSFKLNYLNFCERKLKKSA